MPPAAIFDGAQFIDLFEGVPGHALQCSAVFGGTSAGPSVPVQRYALVTQMVAPLFA
jgi:hypothetical protein